MTRNQLDDRQEATLPPALDALLRECRPDVPEGFALRLADRFDAAVARRRTRRWVMVSAALFLAASATAWLALLNVANVRVAAWHGLSMCAAVIRSLFAIWDLVPVIGAAFAVGTILFAVVIGGIVSRLDTWAYSMK